MQYLLLVCLISLFLISYNFTGKDFFSPANITILVFIGSSVFSVYLCNHNEYSLRGETVAIIVSCLLIGVAIEAIEFRLYNQNVQLDERRISPINNGVNIFALVIVILIAVFYVYRVRIVGGGSGSISDMMFSYRMASAYGTSGDNWGSNVSGTLTKILWAIFTIYSFNILYFRENISKWHRAINYLILFLCLAASLITGGRFDAIENILGFFLMYHIIRMKKNGYYKTYNIKSIAKFLVAVVLVLLVFFQVQSIVGRSENDLTLFNYLAKYLGAPIVNFDTYLQHPLHDPRIFGKETFFSLINNLRKLGIVNVDYYYVHKEFNYINGSSFGNVYTAFRDYYYDFGIWGVYILHTLYSIIISRGYMKTKSKKKNFSIIVMSLVYYCAPLYFWSAQFYVNIVYFGFLLKVALVYLFYVILIEKRVSFKLHR